MVDIDEEKLQNLMERLRPLCCVDYKRKLFIK